MIKVRFGEATIQSCDVMLRDIIESKRVDRLIQMRAENVLPPKPSSLRDRLFIHVFFPAFSGPRYEKRDLRCQIPWLMHSKNTQMNTLKLNGVENWLGWIIWAPWNLRLNWRIGLSPSKRLRCKRQSFMHFRILVFRLLGFC